MKQPSFLILGFLLIGISSYAEEAPADSPSVPPMPPGTPNSVSEKPTENLEFLQRSSAIIASIRDNERQIDPFGFPMDPTNAVDTLAMSEEFEEIDETPLLNASAFKTAVQDLPISGIYPKRQTIVIGARSFSQGDQFGMQLEELTIRLRVEGIKGTSIYFRDMDTQEVATVDFNPKPAEFEPITAGSKPTLGKGIVPMDELFIVN